jgi:1-acyl-sn-glycerol-3-phosphate acyltransferase
MNEKKKNIFLRIWLWIAYEVSRLLYVVLLVPYRPKLITPEGKRYKGTLKGGAILAANHTTFSDPFVVGSCFWYRKMNFFAADVVMATKTREKLLKAAGAIKVNRDITDIEAVRSSVEVLKKGRLLLIFPEGGVQKVGDVQPIKPGAALMALQAGVPIIPLFICYTPRWYNRRRVIIGNPVDPKALCSRKIPTATDIEKITRALEEEMQRISKDFVRTKEEKNV